MTTDRKQIEPAWSEDDNWTGETREPKAKLPGLGAPLDARPPAPLPPGATMITNPLVIMFRMPDGGIGCQIHPNEESDHRAYGLYICDLVRHVARVFNVPEDAVWEWVDKERDRPTTDITGGRVS